jgi:hypothetical protein
MLSKKYIYRLKGIEMHLSATLLFTTAECSSYRVFGKVNLRYMLGLAILILFSQRPER